jgi:hypothetical protein
MEQRNEHLEHGQDTLTEQMHEVVQAVAALSADVRTLNERIARNESRQNQPTQWGWIIAGFGLLIVMAGLLVQPIREKDASHAQGLVKLEERVLYLERETRSSK